MDFENQFTRPMIHALGSRMAILKMESVCDKPDAKFQQGFELGFEEAFNFIREFGRADELIKRLDLREKIKKEADLAKKTGIARVTAVQGKDIEPTPETDEKIMAIPGFAGPVSDAEKIEQNLQEMMDAAGVPDLANEEAVGDKVEVEEPDDSVGVFVRSWLQEHCRKVLGNISIFDTKDFDKTELSKLGLTQSDYLDLMTATFAQFGQNGDSYVNEIMDFLNTVGGLVMYFKNHTLTNVKDAEEKPVDGVPYFKFIVDWLAYYKTVCRESVTTEYILRDALDESDFVTIMRDAYQLFGNKKYYEIDDFKNLVTVYDLGVYLAEHLERTVTFQPSDNEIKMSGVMKYVCERVRQAAGDWTLVNESLYDQAIKSFVTLSDVANIISDAQIKFRRDPSSKIDTSDLSKLYEGTVFDLAKYIVERVNDKV